MPSQDNMVVYNAVRKPPDTAVKAIKGGAYGAAGLSDVNPQWRIEKMTEVYGQYGIGWYIEPVEVWVEHETMFAHILVFTKDGDGWAKPLHGYGGTKFTGRDDDIVKSTITDAFSYACRFLGVAADVWLKQFDGKYSTDQQPVIPPPLSPNGKIQSSVEVQKKQVELVKKPESAQSEAKSIFPPKLAAKGQKDAIAEMADPSTLEMMHSKYGAELENLPFDTASNTIAWLQKGGKVAKGGGSNVRE